jgi:predicted DNA-binding ribbon-helix-helix protein
MASADPARLIKRSVVVAGHRTSVSLEDAFWVALKHSAGRRNLSINGLIAEIDRGRTGNLSSALRVFILMERMTPEEQVALPPSGMAAE